jgi:tRNA threonylcarbamoyladenosine biosynthesis protein TsaB
MLLLAVDTSGPTGSMAFAKIVDGKILQRADTAWIKKAMHSEVATVQLQNLLASCGVKLSELTHLAVNCGPGSFTGLRVGISLVKTLGYSLGLPIAPLSTLEALAFSNSTLDGGAERKIFVATKAVQNFFYCASYVRSQNGLVQSLDPRSAEDSELVTLAAGCDTVLIETQTPGFTAQSSANVLIDLIVQTSPTPAFLNWNSIEPLYIRGSEAEEKLRKGLLSPL